MNPLGNAPGPKRIGPSDAEQVETTCKGHGILCKRFLDPTWRITDAEGKVLSTFLLNQDYISYKWLIIFSYSLPYCLVTKSHDP